MLSNELSLGQSSVSMPKLVQFLLGAITQIRENSSLLIFQLIEFFIGSSGLGTELVDLESQVF